MNIATVMDEGKVQRYLQASEWLVCFKCANPSESEVERWLVWCEEDARNLAAFEELYRDWNDLEGLRTAPELIPATDRQVLGSTGGMRKETGFAFSRFISWPSAAAALLIIFVAGYEFLSQMTAVPRLVTSTNRKPAVLPDGSSLTLSAKAAAEVDFTGPDRDLKLRPEGEAYIKVRHDKVHPFIVRAGTVTVTAIGTAFDVRREGDHAIVSVEEGTVRVAAPGAAGQLQWQASAGYQIDYSEREKTAIVSSIDVQRALQWRSGELSYDRTPLATVIADINRYSTTRIAISDPELERMEFSGSVFVASISDWLTAFETIYPVRASDSSAGVIQLFSARDRDRGSSRTDESANAGVTKATRLRITH
jgi:transmembrane sensor